MEEEQAKEMKRCRDKNVLKIVNERKFASVNFNI